MTDKEKLKNLLCETGMGKIESAFVADSLIAHGVTIREPGCWEAIDSSYWRWYPEGARMTVRVAYRCIRCGRRAIKQENFCPCCGAEMKGESNA